MADAIAPAPEHVHKDTSIKTATLEELWEAWPRGSRKDMLKALGGNVAEALADKEDDSAVRLSAAWNAVGHPTPKSSVFTGKDVHADDGGLIMISAEEVKRLLQDRFGKPKNIADQGAALGKKGIVVFEKVRSLAHSFGAVALWNGAETVEPGLDLFGEAGHISLFELQQGGDAAHAKGLGHKGHAAGVGGGGTASSGPHGHH